MGYKIKDITQKASGVEQSTRLSSQERFLFWVEENRGLVWGGISLVAVVVVAIVALTMLSQQKEEEAWELEGKAQNVYIDRPLNDVIQAKENVQKASTMFQEILDQYPGTTSAQISLYLLGNTFMEEKNYQRAIETYTAFIQQYAQDHILIGLVQQRLGLAHLLNEDPESAMNAFNAVLTNPNALNKDQVIFELAKLAESDEKTEDAVKHYKHLMQEFPMSPFSTEAALRVKVLAPDEADDAKDSADSEEETSNQKSEEVPASEPNQQNDDEEEKQKDTTD